MLDGGSLASLGYASVGQQPWGVDLNPNTGKVYVANFASNDVYVLDAATLALRKVISVGPNPTFVKVNLATNRVFAVTYGNSSVAVINGATDAVEATVSSGGIAAWGLAVNSNLNRVYVSNRDSGAVTTLDGTDNWKVLTSQTIKPCGGAGASPYGMDFNAANNKLYIACSIYHDVNRAAVYLAGGSGLTRRAFLEIDSGGEDGGGGVAVDAATGNVFFTKAASDKVSVEGGVRDLVTATIAVGRSPFGVAADASTHLAYVVNRVSNDLSVILDEFTP